jgi:hypothetical protein
MRASVSCEGYAFNRYFSEGRGEPGVENLAPSVCLIRSGRAKEREGATAFYSVRRASMGSMEEALRGR